MSAKRKQMMRAWNETYGLGGNAVRGITGKKGKITEDDPRFNPSTMGNKRSGRRRRRNQGVRPYREWELDELARPRSGGHQRV